VGHLRDVVEEGTHAVLATDVAISFVLKVLQVGIVFSAVGHFFHVVHVGPAVVFAVWAVMHFANGNGLITRLGEEAWHGVEGGVLDEGFAVAPITVVACACACEQVVTGGHAHGVGTVGTGEGGAALNEAIDVGGVYVCVTQCVDGVEALLVGVEDEDVGVRHFGFLG